MDEGTDGAIGRIPILVSNSGVPCVSSRARDSALQRKNASRSRLRLDGCEIARRYVTFVVVEARGGTPHVLSPRVAWAPCFAPFPVLSGRRELAVKVFGNSDT